MDQAPGVGVGEAGGGLQAHLGGLGGAEHPAVQDLAQAPAGQVLEHHIGQLVVLAPVVDRHDVGMAQPGGTAGLGLEAAPEGLVGGQAGVQDLDGHRPPQHVVLGQIHGRRGARPEGTDQEIAVTQHPAEQISCHRHPVRLPGRG